MICWSPGERDPVCVVVLPALASPNRRPRSLRVKVATESLDSISNEDMSIHQKGECKQIVHGTELSMIQPCLKAFRLTLHCCNSPEHSLAIIVHLGSPYSGGPALPPGSSLPTARDRLYHCYFCSSHCVRNHNTPANFKYLREKWDCQRKAPSDQNWHDSINGRDLREQLSVQNQITGKLAVSNLGGIDPGRNCMAYYTQFHTAVLQECMKYGSCINVCSGHLTFLQNQFRFISIYFD
jgi:hypothetical protein